MTFDLLFTNGTVVTAEGRLGPEAAVAVRDGEIAAVGRADALGPADHEVDLGGDLLVPGVVDCHVHTRSPGQEYKEDWETVTRAAAAGGVTSLLAMPNTDPIIDRPERVETVFELADENALVDFGSYAVVTSENLDEIAGLDAAGVAGYKVFLGTTVGDIDPPDDGELVEAMRRIEATGKRIGFHEENDEILQYETARAKAEGRNRPIDHARSRPVLAEAEAVSRTTLFSERTGCPVHMFHVSSGTAADVVARAKARGVDVTAETTPHYLWFTEEVYERVGNVARIQPPIRDADERDLLWERGVADGGVDCLATDHAPHTPEEKGLGDPFGNTWDSISGFVGLETEVPVATTFVAEGRLSLEAWVRMHSTRPAQVWGMYPQKGSMKVGTDADFTVVDPDREWTFDAEAGHAKHNVTPFDGESFTGSVSMTVVRGTVVYEDGSVCGNPGYGERIEDSGTVDAGR